jgi:hypothetical protein
MDDNFPFKGMAPHTLGNITFFPTPAAAQAVCLRFQAEQDAEAREWGEEFSVQTSAFGWVVQFFNGSPYPEDSETSYYTGN